MTLEHRQKEFTDGWSAIYAATVIPLERPIIITYRANSFFDIQVRMRTMIPSKGELISVVIEPTRAIPQAFRINE